MDSRHEAQIKAEAFDWLVRIQDPNLDPEEPYRDIRSRWITFREWFAESPDHLHAFLHAPRVKVVAASIGRKLWGTRQ
jgi:ferric-dicitrate binding protein FerR (iron transport regulator)